MSARVRNWVKSQSNDFNDNPCDPHREYVAVMQRNFRKYLSLRNWGWFSIIQKTKPLIGMINIEEEIRILEDAAEKANSAVEFEENESKRQQRTWWIPRSLSHMILTCNFSGTFSSILSEHHNEGCKDHICSQFGSFAQCTERQQTF